MQFINTCGTAIPPTDCSPTAFPYRIAYISTFYGYTYIEYYPQDYYDNNTSKVKNKIEKAPQKNKPYYRRDRW